MPPSIALPWLIFFAGILSVFAQESAPSPTPTPSPSPSPTPARSIRISFLPPPLEGKISLGIYDEWNHLVRILHQEADLDEFIIGADALVTKWDGKDNDGFDAAPGSYHARGYLIAPMKIEDSSDQVSALTASLKVKLIANPLENNERPVVELSIGFDDENAFLKTKDGLPLLTLATIGDVKSAALASVKDNTILLVSLAIENTSRTLRVTGIDKLMAFDAGELEIK